MKPSLVIGASGLVGEHLVNTLDSLGRSVVATYYETPIPAAERVDICNVSQVNLLLEEHSPRVVFLPAAVANVDYCETNPNVTYRTNVNGIKHVVDAANKMNARLVYFSTDYIFDGESGPYSEDATANTTSEYGRQKLIAEHYISTVASRFLIIRTTVVYGWERQGKNFIFRLVNSLRQGKPVRAPIDQIGTPTYAPELAACAVQLADMDFQGVINIAGSSCINRYKLALQAARAFHLPEELIVPVTTAELNQPAKRPLRAGLKLEKAARLLNKSFLSSHDGLGLMAAYQPDGT